MTDDFLPRHLMAVLEGALKQARVVNLIGPRQAGKTTLVRELFARGRFLTLDDTGTLEAINADAYGHLSAIREGLGDAPLVIDEA